jgi:hypothetical protein
MKGLVLLIILDHAIPIRIKKLIALIGRLPVNHPIYSEVQTELNNREAGYKGEKSLDFYLSMLDESKYYIFHGLRLMLNKYYFQIDNLLLCSGFGLVIEAKNLAGELHFDKNFNQMIQIKKNISERKINPVLQARLQAAKLKRWLKEHNCKDIPIYYLFVNTNPKTIISSDPGNEKMNYFICNSEFLLQRINQFANSNKREILDVKDIRKINRLLLKNHTLENPDILQHFHLTQNHILTGVKCPPCGYIPMNYHYGFWTCPNCGLKTRTAHIPTINDYFLLIKPSITNYEFRQFLHIASIHIAQKILLSMNLPYSGKFKDRTYHQPPEE